MTTGRPRPILPEQPAGGNHGQGNGSSRRFLPGAIKQLFRQISQSLTLTPTQKRRKKEETRGGFMLAARRVAARTRYLLRPVFNIFIPPDPAAAERLLLWQIEEWNNADDIQQQTDCHYPANDALSLHL